MNTEDDFRDLAPLDPRRDPERWARMLGAIHQAAAPELERRRRMPAPGMMALLSDWVRPTLSAAALMMAAAGATLALSPAAPAETAAATGSGSPLADALGYPGGVVAWAETGQAPTSEELVTALEEDEASR